MAGADPLRPDLVSFGSSALLNTDFRNTALLSAKLCRSAVFVTILGKTLFSAGALSVPALVADGGAAGFHH